MSRQGAKGNFVALVPGSITSAGGRLAALAALICLYD
jgi:hypothetical protein